LSCVKHMRLIVKDNGYKMYKTVTLKITVGYQKKIVKKTVQEVEVIQVIFDLSQRLKG
jgi:hypothetical protein